MKNILLFILLAACLIAGITTYRNLKKEKPLVVIMMGAPGSGKGTHATELSKTLNIAHISTGDLFRENLKNQTELGIKVKELMNSGNLVPDNLVVEMLFTHIKDKGYDLTGYILDGFPRTIIQAKSLDERISNDYKKIALNLNISEDKLIDRITGRLICKSCQASYHKINIPPKKEGICDSCQGNLYQRDDDTEEVLKNRLSVYNKETKPLLEYYKNKKALKEIDSDKDISTVQDNILKTLKETK